MAKRQFNNHQMKFPADEVVSFDPEAFDTAVAGHGVTFVHYRAMRCPGGMIDSSDIRKPHEDHADCSNGFVYTKAGEMTGLFTSNGLYVQYEDVGYLDSSTVQVTLPRTYDGTNTPVDVAVFDRLYLKDERITVPHWQLFEAHQTGRERLDFPAVSITDLMDSDAVRYAPGDYQLANGQIVWAGQKRPKHSLQHQRGQVCAVRYRYRPYWYVQRVLHQTRVVQAENFETGERITHLMPQAFMLQREYVFEKKDKTPGATDPQSPAFNDQATDRSPGRGSFGPR